MGQIRDSEYLIWTLTVFSESCLVWISGIDCPGGGIYCTGGAHVWVSNSIVWGNDQINTYPGEDTWLAAPSYVHTAFSDLGNVANYSLTPGTYVDGGNNFSEDPRFRDAVSQDFHLRGGSPAIGCGLCGSWFLDVGSSRWLYTREAPYLIWTIKGDQRCLHPSGGCII